MAIFNRYMRKSLTNGVSSKLVQNFRECVTQFKITCDIIEELFCYIVVHI